MLADKETDAAEIGGKLRLEILIDVAVEKRVGAGAGQTQEVAQHVRHHQGF